MTIAYFDCFSGISGDMALGALVDAGGEPRVVQAAVEALGLSAEVRITVRHEQRGHLGGTRVLVDVDSGRSRQYPELVDTVTRAGLPDPVRERALASLARLAAAEASVHGVREQDIHLHELSGADTLVDIVGAFWLLHDLAVDAVHASPLPAPRGWIAGDLPAPGPAVMRLLAGTGAVLEPDPRDVELVTPTGAALLATAARFERPAMRLDRVGYGIGRRQTPGNGLAVWLGQPVTEASPVSVLETHLDDITPAQLAEAMRALMEAGALDVAVTPALMKKGRPGHALVVMCEPGRTAGLAQLLLERTSALGLRVTSAGRILAGRRMLEVEVGGRPVRVKVKELGGTAVDVSAEHADAVAAAGPERDPRVVAREAEAEARRRLELR